MVGGWGRCRRRIRVFEQRHQASLWIVQTTASLRWPHCLYAGVHSSLLCFVWNLYFFPEVSKGTELSQLCLPDVLEPVK